MALYQTFCKSLTVKETLLKKLLELPFIKGFGTQSFMLQNGFYAKYIKI